MPTVIKIDDQYAVEESTVKITIAFTDEDGAAATPSTMTWTLTDEDGNIINNRQNVAIESLSSEMDVAIYGDDLIIQAGETGDAVNRIFTIKGTYSSDLGSDLPIKDSLTFPLVNLVAES